MHKVVLLSDNDGTLLNTFPLYDKAMQHVFRNYFSDDLNFVDLRKSLQEIPPGQSWSKVLQHCMDVLGVVDQPLDRIAADYYEYFLANFSAEPDFIFTYTLPLLRRLKELQIPVVIQSGSSRLLLEPIYEHYGLNDYIDGMVCGTDFDSADKAIIIEAAALVVPAEKYVVFGDSPGDINGGRRFGFFTAYVAGKTGWENHNAVIDPHYVFEGDVDGLIDFILNG